MKDRADAFLGKVTDLEAALLLRVSPATAQRWRTERCLPAVGLGRDRTVHPTPGEAVALSGIDESGWTPLDAASARCRVPKSALALAYGALTAAGVLERDPSPGAARWRRRTTRTRADVYHPLASSDATPTSSDAASTRAMLSDQKTLTTLCEEQPRSPDLREAAAAVLDAVLRRVSKRTGDAFLLAIGGTPLPEAAHRMDVTEGGAVALFQLAMEVLVRVLATGLSDAEAERAGGAEGRR